MLNFDLNKFAHTRSGRSQIPDHEVPFHIAILLELLFQEIIVSIADHILQKVLLLYFHSSQPQAVSMQKIQILVHCLNTQVDGLGFEELHQIPLVCQQIFLADRIVVGMVKVDCPEIGVDGVL